MIARGRGGWAVLKNGDKWSVENNEGFLPINRLNPVQSLSDLSRPTG